ncbi:NHS actin remodeling regulator GUK-holder isoform 1-T1 [Glossina fuscipes fuscipes]
MPFVQRVVQPVHIAQACNFISASGNKTAKFNCIADKCQHKHYANKKQPLNELHHVKDSSVNTRERSTRESIALTAETVSYRVNVKSGVHLEVQANDARTPVTQVIVHANGVETQRISPLDIDITDNSSNAIINNSCSSSCYLNASDATKHNVYSSLFPTPQIPIKKLKEHVEFLSSATSPIRSQHTSFSPSATKDCVSGIGAMSKSRSAAVIVAGHEFDSISNITLSNALRQLASLVLIASDIFADLHKELRIVGERARVVQNKIITVERNVSDYDPKTVTVPESDLLTIAQRKTHYECNKSYHKELFTIDTRPCSVYLLYEEAGKVTQSFDTQPSQTSEHSLFTGLSGLASGHVIDIESTCIRDINSSVFGNDVFSHSSFRANKISKMRFDADIEIRLPAAIEDLRKWTSTEAVGDVTVTPDCIHHVDAISDASFLIGENASSSLAPSPSIPSADAVDAISTININHAMNINNLPNDNNKDVPLNHRLPSPEEQSKIIALKYPAEVITVDVSGKRFQRMCMARKSTTSCISNVPNTNNLDSEVQTVTRRSRSRRARGKRRNTIAGTDQKEIQDAANGETTVAGDDIEVIAAENDVGNKEPKCSTENKTKRFGRSKSSDILKKESVTLPYDKGKSTLTRLNSLKQWGRSRFKFMQRNNDTPSSSMSVNQNDAEHKACLGNISTNVKLKNVEDISSVKTGTTNSFVENISYVVVTEKNKIVANQNVNVMEKHTNESRFSHERKPSYSSSEKSVNVNNINHLRGKFHLNTSAGNVKLRDNSSLNRRRNCCLNVNGLSNKEDQPHSSSGNWSASSESGRASIGSEITLQPKSSASNTSLNAFSYQAGSGPPSSMFSRRKFLNTSASSSVTSEGTATPDLQVVSSTMEGAYSNHLDDETSSAYSCDTEGYYTSFHMDSGLRTLKEEDVCMSNFHQGNQALSLCGYAQDYNSSANNSQQTLIGENEYELFGHGSTSTTTSSAGTVCTTLVANNIGGEQNLNNSGASCGPELPERVSSLRNSSASTSTLERSISSSTIGSGVDRTGTIKRNISNAACSSHLDDIKQSSPNLSSQLVCTSEQEEPRKRDPNHLPIADIDYSESSDLEGVERIERIKQKTAINARHIPSMCIITPTTSDDENQHFYGNDKENNQEIQYNSPLNGKNFQTNATKNKASKLISFNTQSSEIKFSTKEVQVEEKSALDEMKAAQMNLPSTGLSVIEDDVLYDTAGEYVYIAADSNNKVSSKQLSQMPQASNAGSLGIYYSNSVTRNGRDLEYVSLNELPLSLQKAYGSSNKGRKIECSQRNNESSDTHRAGAYQMQNLQATELYADIDDLQRETLETSPCITKTPPPSKPSSPFISPHKGARVRLNSVGKPIYDSDSLKRRKGAHTTFIPGPYVKEENESQYTQLPLNNSESDSSAVKLLLLYADNKVNYKMADVKSITNRLATTRPISATPDTDEHGNPHITTNENNKNVLPFSYQQPISSHSLIHSPSTKSNCSSSCSIISSITSSSKSSFSSKDEGYKPIYHTVGEQEQQQPEECHRALEKICMNYSAVERSSPVYWTLQSKRCGRQQVISSISRDDLYATPLKRSDRKLRQDNISSIGQGHRMGIVTSTPMRQSATDSTLPSDRIPMKQPSARSLLWDDNSPDRLNTCADRIGHSKTSLMDFKRLLLAKSVKSNTLPKKLSAVEMLKKNSTGTGQSVGDGRITCTNTKTHASPGSPTLKINSSLNLLDLSGSPKTFANRRMLRQGQFGSPSKSFTPKLKNSPSGWRTNSALRTDIMSTIIPESNSEEALAADESNVSKNCSILNGNSNIDEGETAGNMENFKKKDKEKNIFLQNEQNNFMRGELRSSFGKDKRSFEPTIITPATYSKDVNASDGNASVPIMNTIEAIAPASKVVTTPALETAL